MAKKDFIVESCKLAGYEGADTYNVKIVREPAELDDGLGMKPKKQVFYLEDIRVEHEVGATVSLDPDNYTREVRDVVHAGEDMKLTYLVL